MTVAFGRVWLGRSCRQTGWIGSAYRLQQSFPELSEVLLRDARAARAAGQNFPTLIIRIWRLARAGKGAICGFLGEYQEAHSPDMRQKRVFCELYSLLAGDAVPNPLHPLRQVLREHAESSRLV